MALGLALTANLAAAAAAAAPGKFVSANKDATLYQQRTHGRADAEYTPEGDERQIGLLLANYANRVIELRPVYGNIGWSRSVEDLLSPFPRPEAFERGARFKLSKVKFITTQESCARARAKAEADGAKRDPKPVVSCQAALIVRANSGRPQGSGK